MSQSQDDEKKVQQDDGRRTVLIINNSDHIIWVQVSSQQSKITKEKWKNITKHATEVSKSQSTEVKVGGGKGPIHGNVGVKHSNDKTTKESDKKEDSGAVERAISDFEKGGFNPIMPKGNEKGKNSRDFSVEGIAYISLFDPVNPLLDQFEYNCNKWNTYGKEFIYENGNLQKIDEKEVVKPFKDKTWYRLFLQNSDNKNVYLSGGKSDVKLVGHAKSWEKWGPILASDKPGDDGSFNYYFQSHHNTYLSGRQNNSVINASDKKPYELWNVTKVDQTGIRLQSVKWNKYLINDNGKVKLDGKKQVWCIEEV